MTKLEFKTDDGQKMILIFKDPDLKMNFPKTNTRTVNINEHFCLVSIVTQEEPLSV